MKSNKGVNEITPRHRQEMMNSAWSAVRETLKTNKNQIHHCRKSTGQKYCKKKRSAATAAETVVNAT